jgi:glycosyltransferase involved in cell wall biosynthesis
MSTLSVIIPCHNEAQHLPPLIDKAKQLIKQHPNLEVIFVNNGSTDPSAALLEQIQPSEALARLKVINIANNHGYGYGILVGLSQASGDVLGWTHADLPHALEDTLKLFDNFIERHREQPNIVFKGRRQHRRMFETVYAWIVQWLCRLLIKQKLNDIRCQPKLFMRDFYENYLKSTAPHDFTLDLYTLYQANKHGYVIIERPVSYRPRQHGIAKGVGHWRTGLRQLKNTFSYLRRLKKHKA